MEQEVKSSVLFLKKWPKDHTEELESKKKSIEAKLLKDADYIAKRGLWDREIRQKQKEKVDSLKSHDLKSATAIKQTQAYKEWNAELLAEYAAKIDDLKSTLIR